MSSIFDNLIITIDICLFFTCYVFIKLNSATISIDALFLDMGRGSTFHGL